MPDLSLNPDIGTQRAPRVSPYPDASLYLDFLTMSANFMDSRITFSRGTNATLTDSTGRITYAPANLLLRSQEFDNAAWTKQAATVVQNTAVAPDGTLTADKIEETATTSLHGCGQYVSGSAGVAMTASCYVKAAERTLAEVWMLNSNNTVGGSIRVNLSDGSYVSQRTVGAVTIDNYTITSVGNGWYRVQLTVTSPDLSKGVLVNAIATGTATSTSSYAGVAGSGILVWGAQLEPVTYQTTPSTYVATTSAAYYGPRFDYDPVTLAARGLLIEEQRTNLVTYSEQFDNAAWTKSNATVTGNATMSPDGTMDAEMMIETTASGTHGVWQLITTSSGTTYTYSAYLKYRTRRYVRFAFVTSSGNQSVYADVDLIAGTIVNQGPFSTATQSGATISNVGNGWYRVSVTGTLPSGTTYASIYLRDGPSNSNPESAIGYTGDGTSGIYIWGAQLEAGSFATSYIPTVASTVTRNADVATMTGTNFSAWYNQSEGTFVMSLTPRGVPTGGANVRFLEVNDGTATNRNPLMYASSAGTTYTQYRVAGADQANLGSAAGYYAANSTITIGAAYAANDFATSFSGGAVQTDTSGSVVTNASELDIGYARSAAGTEVFCGHIRTIAYFNTRQPNTQLQTLTAPALVPSLSLDFINNVYNVGF